MRSCDAIIVNLAPLRGPRADAGSAYEMGFMRALGRAVAMCITGRLRCVSIEPGAPHSRLGGENELCGIGTTVGNERLAARIAARRHRLPPGRHRTQPFTAAAVRPLMKYFWKNANRTAMGSVATVDAAMAAPHSGARE
jgi:hypothetical protein